MGLLNKFFFPLFQRNRIHNTFSLYTLNSCLNNFKLRAVYHDGDAGDIRLTLQEVDKIRHGGYTIQHCIIHIHIQHLCPTFYLLPGN